MLFLFSLVCFDLPASAISLSILLATSFTRSHSAAIVFLFTFCTTIAFVTVSAGTIVAFTIPVLIHETGAIVAFSLYLPVITDPVVVFINKIPLYGLGRLPGLYLGGFVIRRFCLCGNGQGYHRESKDHGCNNK